MMKTVSVGIADQKVVKAPEVLVTYALGSCVGICLYDSRAKVAGLSHIMLPLSTQMAGSNQPMKFADTAIPMLIQSMEKQGAMRSRITAKIAGGAQMFAAMSTSAIAQIGERNVVAVKSVLQQLHIPIIAEDCGQNFGRTQFFDADSGVMTIKSAAKGQWNL